VGTINKTQTTARDSQVIAGITKDLKTQSSMPIAGTTYTPVALIALIQSRINAINAVATARANWLDAVKTYQALNTQVNEVEAGLKAFVINLFGKTSPLLADFGFAPTPRAVPDVATKQAANDKRAATRKARNTMSKKQKAKITGATAAAAATATEPTPAATVNQVAQTPTATAPQKS
jgi:hypothetical protein